MNGICAIIVNHNNYPDVLDTIDDLQGQTLAPSIIIVVDNSTDASRRMPEINDAQSIDRVIHIENHGYANAINIGLDYFLSLSDWIESNRILVCTHEVRLQIDCLRQLDISIQSRSEIAAVGPLLTDLVTQDTIVWSAGGSLRRATMTPRHRSAGLPVTMAEERPMIQECDWLDGALVLYRSRALIENPLSEDFFLYFEETDCHTRMRRHGWTIACVTSARAGQSTTGINPLLHGRNLVLFLARNGSLFNIVLGFAETSLRIFVQCIFRRTKWRSLGQFFKGATGAVLSNYHDRSA